MHTEVPEVLRRETGGKLIVISINIIVEGWRFPFVRGQKGPVMQRPEYLCSTRYYEEPPAGVKSKAHEIAAAIFSEVRHTHPSQGVLFK